MASQIRSASLTCPLRIVLYCLSSEVTLQKVSKDVRESQTWTLRDKNSILDQYLVVHWHSSSLIDLESLPCCGGYEMWNLRPVTTYDRKKEEASIINLVFAMDSTDLSSLIRSKNYVEVANIFAKALPDGNPAEFLERVIEALNGGLSHKKSKASASDNASSHSSEGKAPYVLNDAVDDSAITLALQIPEDMNLMAYIIGAKGINVMNIGKSSGTKIQVEKVGTRGADQYRHLFIMGSIKNVLQAYQVLHERLHIYCRMPDFLTLHLPYFFCRQWSITLFGRILRSQKSLEW